MKKISKAVALILTLALMLTILAACGGGTTTQSQAPQTSAPETGAPESSAPSGAAQDPVTLQWAFTPPSGSMDEKWHMHIGDLISEYTSGAVTYEYYPNSTLGNEKVALEGVLSGYDHTGVDFAQRDRNGPAGVQHSVPALRLR